MGQEEVSKPWLFSSECSACSVRRTCPSLHCMLSMQHASLLTMQQGELTACSFRFAFCSHALFISSFQLWSQRGLSSQDWEGSNVSRNPLHAPSSSPFISIKVPHHNNSCSYCSDFHPPVQDGQSAALHLPLSLGSRQLHRSHLLFHLFFEHSTWLSGLREQLLKNKPFHWTECLILTWCICKRWLTSTLFSFLVLQAEQISARLSSPS